MPFSPRKALAVALLAVVAGCSGVQSSTTHDPATERVIVKPTPVLSSETSKSSTTTTTVDAGAVFRWNATKVLQELARQQTAERAAAIKRGIKAPPESAHGPWVATGGGAPCDGDLPPCWRIIGTESGGRWDAFNPGGCGGTGCWGPYQFGGFWAGKLGLPADLTQTTKEQWVNAARTLWNGGAGCSNWSACG